MPVRVCEMCKTGTIEAPGFSAASELERVVFDNRVILLCSEHRDLVDRARTRKLEELFELARQTPERRSLLPRRSPPDRRLFPARPEGRRRSEGRRNGD